MAKTWFGQRLGLLKWYLTEVWPAQLRAKRASRLRPVLAKQGSNLPSLLPSGPDLDLEVHMLCGEATADMGIWASWSIMRFLPGALFYVHSDGSLQEETVATWRRLVPQLRHVPRSDADRLVTQRLSSEFPALFSWWRQGIVTRQNIDYCLFGDRSYILSLDSDVLCFQRPMTILDAVRAKVDTALWMEDRAYAYSIPEEVFCNRYADRVPSKVNGGFWLARRFDSRAWRCMDDQLCAWDLKWKTDYWSPQTLLAFVFSQVGGGALNPAMYALCTGGHREEYVVRHYPGPKFFRPRFFTEGIPAVLRGASCSNDAAAPTLAAAL